MAKLLVLAMLTLFAAGCAQQAAAPGEAGDIVCTVAYRENVAEGISREETARFGAADAERTVSFPALDFHARYSSGELDRERALRTWVTPAGGEEVLHATLYQLTLESGPENQFVGGHGFTGLNYAYDLATGAELQYFCVVE